MRAHTAVCVIPCRCGGAVEGNDAASRCRQILRARWPRRTLLCAQARQRSCESRRPVSSARAVALGTQPVGAECRSTSRRSMDSDPAACTMHRYQHAVVSCMEEVACHSVARSMLHATCRMVYAACCMHHDASGAQGEWLDLVCGGNLTDFPRGFSSTVCRTCRTLTLMVLPHLPVIVQLHRQVSSTRPSPHLRRARTLARGLRRAPSPHLPREPSP